MKNCPACVGLSIQDDPYLPKNDARFANDMPPGHGDTVRPSTGLPKVKQYKIVDDVKRINLIATAYS